MLESVEEFRRTADEQIADVENKFETVWITKAAFLRMLDEIEQEVAERYIELPKDEDGEIIHIGDELYRGRVCRIEMADDGDHKVYVRTSPNNPQLEGLLCKYMHHHHEPTIEDVLREMLGSYDIKRGYTCGHQTPQNEIIAEYAERLQLKEDK